MDELVFENDLFGKKVLITIYDTDPMVGKDFIDSAYKEGLRLQKIFNFYDPESELSSLNKKRTMMVSDELLEVLEMAILICDKTSGEYDITLGKIFLERKTKKPLSDIKCSYKNVLIEGHKVILAHPDALIDLGSVAKGYIADKIADDLINNDVLNGMIDARGDIIFFGDYEHLIEIQHPRDEDKALCSIKIKDLAVATSGDYHQYSGSFEESHILNQKDVISATVVADTLAEADIYATALFVCSAEEREKLLNDRKDIKALIVDKRLTLKTYNGFEELMIKD